VMDGLLAEGIADAAQRSMEIGRPARVLLEAANLS